MRKQERINLVEEANELNKEIARLSKRLDEIKTKFRNKGDGVYIGETIAMNIETRNQLRFSTPIAKSIMTPDQLSKCFVESSSQVVTFIELE